MKRVSVALAIIGLSSSLKIFAAFPATNDPTLINIPQLPGGFFVGVSGFYLQPSATNGDLDYAVVTTGTAPNFHSDLKSVDSGYDWGWGINVGYIFPNTGNDINFSYVNYFGEDSNFVTGTNLNIINPNISLTGNVSNYANAKSEYDIDQVDVFGGQYINVGCRLILHPTLGMRWAQLERDISGTYIASDLSDGIASTTSTFSKEISDFNGIGPLLGLDASYYLIYGIGVVGHFDSAVLAGNMETKINTAVVTSTTPTIITTNTFHADDTTRVLPIVDAKLGLDYTYLLHNSKNSDLTLEAGWQFSHYYRALDRIYANTTGISATINQRKTSDIGFNGPYVNLVFHI